jgi:hypothetical protein
MTWMITDFFAAKRHRRHKIHQRERHEPRGILTTDEPGVFYGGRSPRNGHVRVRTCLVHGRTDLVHGRRGLVCARTLRVRARTGAVRPGTGREGGREKPPNKQQTRNFTGQGKMGSAAGRHKRHKTATRPGAKLQGRNADLFNRQMRRIREISFGRQWGVFQAVRGLESASSRG